MNRPRLVLLAIAIVSFLTGIAILAAPKGFYDAVPGLVLMGPFNVHFLRDVGLAYLSSGVILASGGLMMDRRLALAGSFWLSLHAVFHLQVWWHRGFPVDQIFWFDLFAVISPAGAAFAAALYLPGKDRAEYPPN